MANNQDMFWLISAPPMPTKERTFENVREKCSVQNKWADTTKFAIPSLRVGTLDELMSMSDDLVKMDNFVEQTTRKTGMQLLNLLDQPEAGLRDLVVDGASIDVWLSKFRWHEAKYPIKLSCRELADQVQSQVSKIDEELRTKLVDYQTVSHNVAAAERKRHGTLAVRDLADIVKPSDMVADSEYLTTVFVVVPKYSYKEWESSYERLVSNVVPRSSKLITEDAESGLWSIVLFKRVIDDFKNIAREKRFTVREMTIDTSNYVSGQEAHSRLLDEKERLKNKLLLWCKANFAECFIAWVHLKAVRVHVESILRYGLPANFQAILCRPNPKHDKKLRTALEQLFQHLGSSFLDDDDDEVVPVAGINEKFYPYVYLELNLRFQ